MDVNSAVNTAIRKIRLALRDDSEEPKYIETVPGRGYRFIAQLPPEAEEIRFGGEDSILIRPSIAVLPLDDLSDDAADYFSEVMTEEILTQLGRLRPRLGVIARASVMKYKGTRYESVLDDILKLQDRLAREIAAQISSQLKVDPPAAITCTPELEGKLMKPI